MRLTRATVTVASRIMLPTYVGLALVLGLVYLFDPLGRLDGVHALAYPRQVMGGSMQPWGWVFLVLAGVMVFSFTRRSRFIASLGLCCFGVTMLMWAGMYAVSVVKDPLTSVLAPVYPFFAALCCLASVMSLAAREV